MEITNTSPVFSTIQTLLSNRDRLLKQLRDRNEAIGITGRDRWLNRAPMIITTDNWVLNENSGRYIILWANPSNVEWRFPQRGVEQQTRSGWIRHMWRDSARSSFFDNPELNFTFQTGNVLPVRVYESIWEGGGRLAYLPPGLLDFYDFFDLMDEKPILSDGRPNSVYIIYRSLLYPLITLRGFFKPDVGINITDDANNPGGYTWTSTFRVRASNPAFYKGRALYNSWLSQFNSNDISDADANATLEGLGINIG